MVKKARAALQEFIRQETSAGIILFCAAVAAMIAINSAFNPYYLAFLNLPVAVQFGALEIAKPLSLWINDGLMAIFFFLVGLEVKRELLEGQLSSVEQAALPAVAAIGGMALPALVFLYFNWTIRREYRRLGDTGSNRHRLRAWRARLAWQTCATLAEGLLLAIAIIDDIGAIIIIAFFYTAEVSTFSLLLAGGGTMVLFAMNRLGVIRTAPYILVGIFLWICVLKSGVHATLAGVIAALAIPLNAKGGSSPLKHLEHFLHPWTAFLVLPLFAFANAGVSLAGLKPADLMAPLALGIAAGLVIGKQLGVFGFMYLATRIGLVKRPDGVTWLQLYGLACLTGIGFTMSLFIGNLAFVDPDQIETVKLGVISGSLISGRARLWPSAAPVIVEP